MYYQLFAQKVAELSRAYKQSNQLAIKKLSAEIDELVQNAPIKKLFLTEYIELKQTKQVDTLNMLCKQITGGQISYASWSLLMDLEAAAFSGDVESTMTLLEDDDLKACAAFNYNWILRRAAMANHQDVVAFLLNISSVRTAANHVARIQSKADKTAQQRFCNLLNMAMSIEQLAAQYLDVINELISEGDITDLDWKYLPAILSINVKSQSLKNIVSFMAVLPSVRIRADQDAEFRDLLFKTKLWLKNEGPKPVPHTVPRIVPYVVRLGVSAFNLVSYEKFLEEKAVRDKLREHYSEADLQRLYPESFPPKPDPELYHSFTIQNNVITNNGVRRGKIKP